MLAYAANTPNAATRAGSPKALTLIIAGHALAIAAAMTAKPDVFERFIPEPPIVVDFPAEPTPAEPEPRPQDPQVPFSESVPTKVPVDIPLPPINPLPPIGDTFGNDGAGGSVIAEDPPMPDPVRVAVRFDTPPGSIKPPYPINKRRLGEEATLRLKLTIDARGRVIGVEPVGVADEEFLAAARRHIIRAWRYKPATVDGVAVNSSTVITLSFRLEEA